MRATIHGEIKTAYENQRQENRRVVLARVAEASEKDADIGALFEHRRQLFGDTARKALADPAHAMEITGALAGKLEDIQRALSEKLVRAGFPGDYLQPVYACETCKDTGYIGEPVQEKCACYERRLRERLALTTDNGLDPTEAFETYDEMIFTDTPLKTRPNDTQRRFMSRVRKLCEDYANAYPGGERRNMVLFGQSGLGKTFMLNCMGNRVQQNGYDVLKVTAYQLMERVRAAKFHDQPEEFEILLQVPVLLLDDLGAEPLYNNLTVESIFTLLNERSLAKKHTVISTNLMLDELRQRYTERVSSRLFDKRMGVLVQFHGDDVRMR